MEIVGICGFMGSGKDTIAKILIDNNGFEKISFSGILKDIISIIFGWDRDMLEGCTKESRQWREQVDEWWATRLGIPNLTPRWILQYWGTDVCRNHFHEEIWIAAVEKKIFGLKNKKIVITDCRFPNEIDMIKKLGGKIYWIRRSDNPLWVEDYLKNNIIPKVHYSEYAWLKSEFNNLIDNSNDLLYLENEIKIKILLST